MPAYITDPTVPRTSLMPGKPCYSWGSLNDLQPTSRMAVTAVALASDVATLTVTMLEGPIPAVGSLITVKGTQSGSGEFNVLNIALTGVSISASTGQGTVTFALTGSNLSTTSDSGMAYVPQPVVGETLQSSATAGQQFAVPVRGDDGNNQHGVSASVVVTGSPTAYTVNIQGANVDQNSEYTTIATISNTEPGSVNLPNFGFAFVRAQQSGSGGTSPTVAVALVLN